MAERAKSISVSHLSAAAHKAAQSALKENPKIKHFSPEPGILLRPWIIGIIFRNAEPQYLAEFQTLAGTVAKQLPGEGGPEALYHFDNIFICGRLPAVEVDSLETYE